MRADAGFNYVQAGSRRTPEASGVLTEREAIQNQPHLLFVSLKKPEIAQVKLMALDPAFSKQAQTALTCERVHYAAGNGICLMYDTSGLGQLVWVTLFGSDFEPRYQFSTEGLLSRARVSPDGRFAAFTVFVTGHSYNDANMSTATFLLDTATGENLGNLEEFETWKDGQIYKAPEFNFWGVTFAQDSNLFYATLQHGSTTYLVQGDVAAREFIALHENVECPSLSPDGTRIALFHTLVQASDMSVLPARMHPVLRRGIGCFHESPFEIMVGLLGRMPIADSAATAFHSWYGACITGQLLSP